MAQFVENFRNIASQVRGMTREDVREVVDQRVRSDHGRCRNGRAACPLARRPAHRAAKPALPGARHQLYHAHPPEVLPAGQHLVPAYLPTGIFQRLFLPGRDRHRAGLDGFLCADPRRMPTGRSWRLRAGSPLGR